MIIKAAKRIFNPGKICHSYSDLNFGITFLEHSVHPFPVTVEDCSKLRGTATEGKGKGKRGFV